MTATLVVRDETIGGREEREFTIDFLTDRITVRELIRSRVYQEAQDYALRKGQPFRGLVQPAQAEAGGQAPGAKTERNIDWRKQFDAVVEAFERNRIVVLVDDRQLSTLDEQIEIKPGTRVTFLKLVPLIGG